MTPTRSILGCLAALTVLTSGCASSEKLVASPASSSPSTATDSTDAEVDRSPFEKPVELPTDSTTSRERKAAARLLRQAKRTLLRTGTGHLTRAVEWSVHGIDIQAALESASIRVGRKYRKSLPYVDISMRLQEPGSRVRVPLPPKNKQAEAPLGSRRFDPDACGVGAEVV
jgi:hypothetical protein